MKNHIIFERNLSNINVKIENKHLFIFLLFSYFFKLNNHLEAIKKTINNVNPIEYQKDLLNKLENGLNDLSISRKNIKWGIELPFDESHTIYVWFENNKKIFKRRFFIFIIYIFFS
jgi:methionyl-tRNA synthetase